MNANASEPLMNKHDQGEETLIVGYAALAQFLTKRGFRITKGTLHVYHTRGYGPPIEGRWGNRSAFYPSKAIAWARDRMRWNKTPTPTVANPPVPVADGDDIPPL